MRIKKGFDYYTNKGFTRYYNIVEAAKKYEDLINWNIAYIFDYNPAVKLGEKFFVRLIPPREVSHDADSISKFAKFCNSCGIPFFYVNIPNKVCASEDKNISGVLDFSNQNADKFLNLLGNYGVKYYDLRKNLHAQGMNHHEAFFITDLHWRQEAGFWAAREILKFLRDDYNWPVKPEILNPENFYKITHPNTHFGSEGVKLTLSRVKPEDMTLHYPKFKTLLNYKIPDDSFDKTGDFSITYNMGAIAVFAPYTGGPYAVYGYGNRALITIENLLPSCDKKLLIIDDSFGKSVSPFIALAIKNVVEINLHIFPGSIRSYIESERPDAVIVMYYPGIVGKEYKMFDFR